jgi:electron transfer flavoprotein alpha subunit
VLADHDNKTLADSTLNAVTAAGRCGGSEVTVLVLGSGAGGEAVAAQAAKVSGVSRVLLVDQPEFAHALAEHSSTVAAVARAQKASHVLAPTSASGKNILPRLGAHLDVQPITEVVSTGTLCTRTCGRM